MPLPTTSAADLSHGLVGQSPEIRRICRLVGKLAHSRSPVLLLGESGTGKEVVARAIYEANPSGEFVPIDCGSLVGPLMESELFGHTRGAFTGAAEPKKGLIELADGGTAFFDEIGDLPLDMQVKLLRLLQEHEFRPVGSLQRRKVDMRVIAATHRDLEKLVAAGHFRPDLYYRLNVARLHLPPLRERKEDIPVLIEHFLAELEVPYGFAPEALDLLLAYDWPGNVRELRNVVERMAALNSGPLIHLADLPSQLQTFREARAECRNPDAVGRGEDPVFQLSPRPAIVPLPETEKRAIIEALEFTRWERGRAARLLGISRTTLYRKLKVYKIAR